VLARVANPPQDHRRIDDARYWSQIISARQLFSMPIVWLALTEGQEQVSTKLKESGMSKLLGKTVLIAGTSQSIVRATALGLRRLVPRC
jgi:hypothetical protein